MLSYQAELEAAGGMVVLRAPVVAGRVSEAGFALEVGGAEPMDASSASLLVNSAGVHAPATGAPHRRHPGGFDPARLFLPRRLFHARPGARPSAA